MVILESPPGGAAGLTAVFTNFWFGRVQPHSPALFELAGDELRAEPDVPLLIGLRHILGNGQGGRGGSLGFVGAMAADRRDSCRCDLFSVRKGVPLGPRSPGTRGVAPTTGMSISISAQAQSILYGSGTRLTLAELVDGSARDAAGRATCPYCLGAANRRSRHILEQKAKACWVLWYMFSIPNKYHSP